MKLFWIQYIVSCIVITICAGFIHLIFNSPPDWSVFAMWIPMAWVLTLGLALMINLLLNSGDKK